ncbi:MAG: four helix bundle protein [Candidatus Peribacteraceae bacterium]|nr:four helix bundle protein [Candidatus Peribacteraceae bacterium]
MDSENPVRTKAYAFAVRIVKFCRWLQKMHHEFVLSKQLLRSGTSIGANIEEAQQAQSRKDFLSKMSIALKESFETDYWLRLMRDSLDLPPKITTILRNELEEILKLLTAIVKSSKK